MMDALRYAQLLSSRMCHDLITPVSAIQSGFELMPPEGSQELLDLIKQSADTAIRRLVFFRNAFGSTSASNFSSFETIEKLISDFCTPIKMNVALNYSLSNPDLIDFPLLGRMLLNLTLIMCDLAPLGGNYTITVTQDNHIFGINMALNGTIFEMQNDIQKALTANLHEADLTPQTIQAFMTWELITLLEMEFVLHTSTRSSLTCELICKKQPSLYETALF